MDLITLDNGETGYFVPGKFDVKDNDAGQTPRQLFVKVDKNGNEIGSSYYDPNGSFVDMTKGNNINAFIDDPDTYDSKNPSGFDPKLFGLLQSYKGNAAGLKSYLQQHPELTVFKQNTIPKGTHMTQDDMNLPEPTFNSDSGGIGGLLSNLFPGNGGGIGGSGFGMGDIGLLGLGGALGGGPGIAAALAIRFLPQLLQALSQGKANAGATSMPQSTDMQTQTPQQTEFYNPAPSLDSIINTINQRRDDENDNLYQAKPSRPANMSSLYTDPRTIYKQLPLTIQDIIAQSRGSANGQY